MRPPETGLLFLHADTILGDGWARAVQAHMAGSSKAAVFRFRLDDTRIRARILELLVHWRCRLFALPYGDQGLLISRSLYDETGGFRPLPLMEDVDLVRRIGRRRLASLDVPAITSAQRYVRDGYVSRIARNLACLAMWSLGVSPDRIRRFLQMNARPRHLLVMAKQPRIGRVKTRLGAGIGAMEATRAYRVMLAETLNTLSRDPRWQTWVAVSGVHELNANVWPNNVHLVDQGTGDLGDRMQRMFDTLPIGPVVIIGSDIPHIAPADIADAFRLLGRHDAVFGPAPDGGYWLVGQSRRRTVLKLFDNVRWSSEHALSDTMANLDGAPGKTAAAAGRRRRRGQLSRVVAGRIRVLLRSRELAYANRSARAHCVPGFV